MEGEWRRGRREGEEGRRREEKVIHFKLLGYLGDGCDVEISQ